MNAQKHNLKLDSWMFYTKGGKPKESGQLWKFLDQWKNWIPEAHGKFAKYIEVAKIKANELAID